MSDRYDAVAVRKYEDRDGNEKSAFTNIGVAFPMKDRDGYSIRLHAMPAPIEGEYTILLFPPQPKEDKPAPQRRSDDTRAAPARRRPPVNDDLDDEIPF